MNTVQKVAVLIAGTGLITALVLPGRQTPAVANAFFGGLSKWQKTSMGQG
jgi:hypothetical protein